MTVVMDGTSGRAPIFLAYMRPKEVCWANAGEVIGRFFHGQGTFCCFRAFSGQSKTAGSQGSLPHVGAGMCRFGTLVKRRIEFLLVGTQPNGTKHSGRIAILSCGHSSAGRARPCQGRGREFEPRCPLQIVDRVITPNHTIYLFNASCTRPGPRPELRAEQSPGTVGPNAQRCPVFRFRSRKPGLLLRYH